LTGIDASDPTPGIFRELKFNQGEAGGQGRPRAALIMAHKNPSTGSASVDGLGDAINTPRLIIGPEELIDRAGYHCEALLLYQTFRRFNTVTDVYMVLLNDGSTTPTVDFTFATNATAASAVEISFVGEKLTVPIASGDTVTTIAAACVTAINQQLHWPVTASNVAGVLTWAVASDGLRMSHYADQARMRIVKPCGTTVTKGAVTAGTADEDQTTAIANIAAEQFYYQVNPNDVTSAPTATDNGIGEHLSMIETQALPINGKGQVLAIGVGGTNAQAITVAQGMNSPRAFCVWTEDNDYSAGMVATEFVAILSMLEVSDKAAKLADYGPGMAGGLLSIPDPFDKTDRPTATEIKAALNAGVTPIAFNAAGQPYIVWHITTKSVTNSIADYRARPGHLPSVMHDFWDSVQTRYTLEKQDRVADDPGENEKPLPGFMYPRTVRGIISQVIDDKIDGALATLDPSERQTMKDSIDVGLLSSGFSCRVQPKAVRHNLRAWFRIEETSPSI
jgi:phage tail sheath gpL-like